MRLERFELLFKRDPVLWAGSVSLVTEVAFAEDDRMYMGMGTATAKNADFDGDRGLCYPVPGSTMARIISLTSTDPRHGAYKLFSLPQYAFTESFVVAMFRCNLPPDFPHRALFNLNRRLEVHRWLASQCRRTMLEQFADFTAPFGGGMGRVARYIDPVRHALTATLDSIDQLYGPTETHRFYYRLVRHVVQTTCHYSGCQCNYEHWREGYFMDTDPLGPIFMATAMSEATGSAETMLSWIMGLLLRRGSDASSSSLSASAWIAPEWTAVNRYEPDWTAQHFSNVSDDGDDNLGVGDHTSNRPKDDTPVDGLLPSVMDLHHRTYASYRQLTDAIESSNAQLALKSSAVSSTGNHNFQQQKAHEQLSIDWRGHVYFGGIRVVENVNRWLPTHVRLTSRNLVNVLFAKHATTLPSGKDCHFDDGDRDDVPGEQRERKKRHNGDQREGSLKGHGKRKRNGSLCS